MIPLDKDKLEWKVEQPNVALAHVRVSLKHDSHFSILIKGDGRRWGADRLGFEFPGVGVAVEAAKTKLAADYTEHLESLERERQQIGELTQYLASQNPVR